MDIKRFSKDAIPFVVYAIASPVFSDRLLIWPDRKQTLHYFNGTEILISSGMLEMNEDSSGTTPFVFMESELLHYRRGQIFAEQVIGSLLQPDDKIMMFCESRYLDAEWLEIAEKMCVDIYETQAQYGDKPEVSVCTSKGSQFATDRLLNKASDGGGAPWILASQEPENIYQKAYLEAIYSGDKLSAWMDYQNYYGPYYHRPEDLLNVLGDYRLLAEFAGPDYSNLSITVRNTVVAIDDIQNMMKKLATEESIELYYAGELGVPDETGAVFENFPLWASWHPMPKQWKRII